MANIGGLFGALKSDGSTSALLAAYGNDLHILSGSDWQGQGQNVAGSSLKWEFAQIHDIVLGVNGTDDTRRYDYTSFKNEVALRHSPISKFIHVNNAHERAYFGNIKYHTVTFNTRVWHSDIPKADGTLTYGLEYGTTLAQTAVSGAVFDQFAGFKTRNIKIGDPFVILTGTNAGIWFVKSIDTEQQITLDQTNKQLAAATGSSYWVGSNYIDIQTEVMGLGENSDRELFFGRDKLFSYDRTTPRQIKGVPGTTSHRSIANVKQWTFWFHSSGIYRLEGTNGELISRAMQPWIDGISASNYANVVAEVVGSEKDRIRFHVGNISNTDENISITNGFLEFDTSTNTWTPGSTANKVIVTSRYIESGADNVYVGDDSDQIFQDDTGNSDDSGPIEMLADTDFHFPREDDLKLMLEFTRVLIFTNNNKGMPVKYKIYGKPLTVDQQWKPLGDTNDYVTELSLEAKRPDDTLGRGIAFLVSEISQSKPPVVERIDVYYKERYDRSIGRN